jgi:hypothetical protein
LGIELEPVDVGLLESGDNPAVSNGTKRIS